MTANGLRPDTPISLGADGAYRFWLVDLDIAGYNHASGRHPLEDEAFEALPVTCSNMVL